MYRPSMIWFFEPSYPSDKVLWYVLTAQKKRIGPNDYIIRLTDKGGRAGDGPVRLRFAQRIGVKCGLLYTLSSFRG